MSSNYFLHLKIHLFKILSCVNSFFVCITMASSSQNLKKYVKCEINKSQARREDDDSTKKVIQPWYLEPSLLKSHKPYHLICQSFLKELFNQISDRILPNIVREFYINMRLIRTFLKTYVIGVEIDLHKDQFGRIFELPNEGISYTFDKPIGFKNFKHSTTINALIINHMEKKKVPFKLIHLKPRVRTLHYLLTRILFSKIINHDYIVKKDLVLL